MKQKPSTPISHTAVLRMVNLNERALAGEVVAAGQGVRANLAFSEQIVREMRGALTRMKKLGSIKRTEREDAIAAVGTELAKIIPAQFHVRG